ncbi:O-antigen polymerase [Aliarcobacter butzleri]
MLNRMYIYNFLIASFIITSSLFLYFFQIQETNEYMGLKYFAIEPMYVLIVINSLVLIGLVIKLIKKNLPSNYLIYIYILFVIIWNILFYKSTNLISYELYLVWFILILLPLFCILLFNKFFMLIIEKVFFEINILKFLKLEYLLSLFLFITLFIVSLKMSISFSFNDSYVRRLDGRELITGVSAYLFAMSMNSIAPFLAFYAFLKKKYFYFLISFIFVILCFGFIGSKAPIGYVILLSYIGFLFSKSKKINIFNFFLVIIFFIFFLSIIEYFIFDFSTIADIIIRRAFIVVAQNQTYFIDFIINNFTFENWLFGYLNDKPITFLIGELYYNNINTNANTNAFLYEFISNGMVGYFFMILFLSFFFSLLNFLYIKYNSKEVIGISIIYSLLLTEQAYTTAFITSGIGFLAILVILTLRKNKIK